MRLNSINKCKSCNLCKNQAPLIDSKREGDVFWVGLSSVKIKDNLFQEKPLSPKTNTGKLIAEIENNISSLNFYKTNIVKCLPLRNGKIRYPSQEEMSVCYKNLQYELTELKPKVVFMLGKQVSDFITLKLGDTKEFLGNNFEYKPYKMGTITFVPIHHPSYILIYKRKKIKHYIKAISTMIQTFAC